MAGYRIAGVKVKIDPELLGNFLRSPDGVLPRWMMGRATVVQLAAIRDCPKGSPPRLSESIIKRGFPVLSGGYMVSIIAATYYAYWVHEGTGIYGPHGSRIYPTTASVLHWIGKDGASMYATSIAGMKGHKFLSQNLPLFFAGA